MQILSLQSKTLHRKQRSMTRHGICLCSFLAAYIGCVDCLWIYAIAYF